MTNVKIMKGTPALVYLLSTFNSGVMKQIVTFQSIDINHVQFSPPSCKLLVPRPAAFTEKVKVKLPQKHMEEWRYTSMHTAEHVGRVLTFYNIFRRCWV
jgi:hypothetical protein